MSLIRTTFRFTEFDFCAVLDAYSTVDLDDTTRVFLKDDVSIDNVIILLIALDSLLYRKEACQPNTHFSCNYTQQHTQIIVD